eukprot:CAMPEP_0201646416 /NCGR_PEP_ID=MMETSP0493-20130528/33916_1 /ASSEMBLY_ACC=CAM_ASM_000838 /TAXON_ID=420259 /ORGANISM="Thalassiosira gravida, Strain GMp14c1" /LENGTH=33 /DNA_ID= /DNA_START= /DNA_END= /DNA_ORIENTATION=
MTFDDRLSKIYTLTDSNWIRLSSMRMAKKLAHE